MWVHTYDALLGAWHLPNLCIHVTFRLGLLPPEPFGYNSSYSVSLALLDVGSFHLSPSPPLDTHHTTPMHPPTLPCHPQLSYGP